MATSPTPLTITPEHYWPGVDIPMPLPANGVSLSFSNEFVLYLPFGVNRAFYQLDGPGLDLGRPGGEGPNEPRVFGGIDVLWSMVGEGKWVDFWCQGVLDSGCDLVLFEAPPDQSSWYYAAMADTGTPEGSGGVARSGGSGAGSSAALRVFLKNGYHYVLQVLANGSGTNLLPDPTAPYYSFGDHVQNFYLEVSYTPLVLPDLKSNAYDVIIASNGATYTSPNVLNTTFTSSAEDPPGTSQIWATAWWKYTPTADGAVTISWALVPALNPGLYYTCFVYKLQTDGSLIQLAAFDIGAATVPVVNANDVLYISIGSRDYYNNHQSYSQKYQLQVTGAKSAVQADSPEHYWPGKLIPTPLPTAGTTRSFSNSFIKDLPDGYTEPDHIDRGPGADVNRPPGAPGSAYDVLWHIIGEGKWVDIYVQGFGSQGQHLGLYERSADGSSWAYATMPDDGMPSGGGGAAAGGSSDAGGSAAVRVFLKPARDYVAVVESASLDRTVGPGAAGYDQSFYMEVSYTPLILPDLKSNALDVIIPTDGATYTTVPVLNTTFSSSSEDPQGNVLATAWWKYEATKDTTLTVSFAIIPSVSTQYGIWVWRKNADGSLTQLAAQAPAPRSVTVPAVAANDVIYFQIGGIDFPYNGHSSYSQKYQLQVTGAKSKIQAPGPLGPDNDLRAHAITVSVGSDDLTYLSDDTTLTYATPGAVGADPWPVDRFGVYAHDTEAAPLYQTAWWSYKPIAPGLATLRAHSNPADSPEAQVMVLDSDLVLVGYQFMGQDLVFNIDTLHTYFIVLGTRDPGIAVSASFGLAGQPTAGAPPVNDLRSHAIKVSITNDGDTYLCTNTQLDYATPAAVGEIVGQYLPDPEASPLYQSAWWVYKPTESGTVAIRAHSDPADDASVKLMILHNLTPLATIPMTSDYTHQVVHGETYYYVLGTVGQAFASASFGMTGPTTVVPTTTPDPTPPVTVPPGTKLDPYVPGATADELESGTSTLLDLVRAFSTAVRRAVRITGPSTIEMVNPAAPLPAGWHDTDADSMYVLAGRSAAATTTVLSLSAGDVILTATAQVKADDVRIPASSWRIPDRLPLYGLPSAAVQRVTYTFSPTEFTASLDLHYADVPLIAKGSS